MYGEETRPLFMTEFGSKEPPANHWPDLREQIESARSTRQYAKAMIFVMCGEDPYSLRLTVTRLCDTRSTAFSQLDQLRYNAALYGADSVQLTDVVIYRRRGDIAPIGYDVVDDGNRFVIRNVAVHHREPTRIRFRGSVGATGLSSPGIQYRVFVDRFGWTEWVTDSAPAGSAGQNRPVHAVQARTIRDAGFRALYGVFQRAGWTDWASNGVIGGDTNTVASGLRATLAYADGAPVTGRAVCYQVADLAGSWSPAQCDAAPALATTNTVLGAVRMWFK